MQTPDTRKQRGVYFDDPSETDLEGIANVRGKSVSQNRSAWVREGLRLLAASLGVKPPETNEKRRLREGSALFDARHNADLSLGALGRAIGCTHQTVKRMEDGEIDVTPEARAWMAERAAARKGAA